MYRDLFASSSDSWYHSRVGGGTAVNWQWSMASSFLSTTRSSGDTTGFGKLLSVPGRRQKRLRDFNLQAPDHQIPSGQTAAAAMKGHQQHQQQQRHTSQEASLRVCQHYHGAPGTSNGVSEKDLQVICPVISSSSFDYVAWTVPHE